MPKIWFKLADPTVIISTGKSVGNPDENYFESSATPEDDEFYSIDHSGSTPIIIRKSQPEIDIIVAARQQDIQDVIDELNEALGQLSINQIINLDYSQVTTYINNNVIDLPSAKTVLIEYGKIILGLLKYIKAKRI